MIPPALLEKAKAKGPTEEFEAYARTFPSVLSLRFSEFPNGDGRCEFSHKREVAAGAGIAIKPPYSGVPLTNLEHRFVHLYGESHFNPKEWWIEQRNLMLQKWVNGVKPISTEEYNEQREIFIKLGSPQHIRAFELCVEQHFLNPNNPPVEMSMNIREVRQKRTTKQNSAQWGVIYNQMVDFYNENNIPFLWDMARALFRGFRIKNELVHEMSKYLFNEGQSTRLLTRDKHSRYFDKIQRHFIKNHEFEIKPPIKRDGLELFESRFN